MSNDRLTAKQKRFIDEYVICLNGTEAARRAQYDGDDATLAVIASQNLRKLNISRAIGERLEQFAMPANEVLSQLTDIARDDITDALNAFGGIDIGEAKRRGKSHLIKRYKTKVTTITDKDGSEKEIIETEIEMYDRLAALQTLAKYHDLTNTIKVEDWRSEIIALLKEGKVSPERVVEDLGYEIAQELFITAGVSSDSG
jgi:phage terminase small subunit